MNAILKTVNRRGKYFDSNSKYDVINYILNPDKVIHNYCGTSVMVDPNNIVESMEQVSAKFNKEKGVQLRHFVLSFLPYEFDPAVANEIGQRIMQYLGQEYQAVYAVHEDRDHIHIHCVMNSVSHADGHRYYGTRAEFNSFMSFLRKLLRSYGIYNFWYEPNRTGEGICE